MMRNLLFSLLVFFSGSTFALDYSDHIGICKTVEANTKHAVSNDVKGRQKQCVCEVAELEKLVEPDMYRLMIDWKIDAKAFAKNNTNLDKNFLSDAISNGMKATLACQ